jgi:hypothetical protein
MTRFVGYVGIVRRAAILSAMLCCGCQRYVDLVAAPSAGDARLTLVERGSGVSYGAIGSAVRQVEGRIRSTSDSSIEIYVTAVTRQLGFEEPWTGELVSIPRQDVTRIEAKTVSVPRTLVTIGGLIAGGIAARGAINGGESTSSGVKKPGGGN